MTQPLVQETADDLKARRRAEKKARRVLQRSIAEDACARLFADPRWRDLLGEDKFLLIDVGAQGGLQKEFIPATPLLRVLAIEPRIIPHKPHSSYETSPVEATILHVALGAEPGVRQLHTFAGGAMASFLQPDVECATLFGLSENIRPRTTIAVETTTLDALVETQQLRFVDFIKLDTQGSELEILRGGERAVGRLAFGLRIEVSFSELYESQPLFADIDPYVRSQGFEFVDFVHFRRWTRTVTGAADAEALKATAGQLVVADALYFRPPTRVAAQLESLASADRVRYLGGALVACLIYRRLDYAANLIAAATPLIASDPVRVMLDLLRTYSFPSSVG